MDSGLIFETIKACSAVADPLEAAAGYRAAIRTAYWDHKSVDDVVVLSAAVLGRLHGAAEAEQDDAARGSILGEAKAFYYDLASFTWPGWGEAGIELDAYHEGLGLQAARENLRLAIDLDKDDIALSRAWWMLGGHQLSAVEHEHARSSFGMAGAHADQAGSEIERELAAAFAALTAVLEGANGADRNLDDRLKRLGTLEDGDAFVEQVTTAQTVFSGRGS